MLNVRLVSVLVGAALVLSVSAVQAEPTLNISSIEAGRYKTVNLPQNAPLSITQNVDPNTVQAGVSVACSAGGVTTDNSFVRAFDLDGDHGAVGQFCVKDIDYAVETSTGPVDMTVNTYCLDDGLPLLFVFLNLVDSVAVVQQDAVLEFFNVTVNGCCDSATQSLVVEFLTEDCLENGTCLQYFQGANSSGQIAPSFVAAADCGILDPTDLALIGFPDDHLVMVVNGNDDAMDGDGDGDGDGDVPAVSGIGMLLMVLILLGTTAFFTVRRRITN